MTNQEIIRALRRAQRLARLASQAAVHADAAVASYWVPRDVVPSPYWLSRHVREAADMAYGLSTTLVMTAYSNLEKQHPEGGKL